MLLTAIYNVKENNYPNCNYSFSLTTFTLITFLLIGFAGFSQTTAIPDGKFEDTLITLGIDSNGKNNTILNSDAQAVYRLFLDGGEITNLTGIEAFINLTYLSVIDNRLTNLNFSKNTTLEFLFCDNNQLINLDISKNTDLITLYCSNNKLASLDVSTNTALRSLRCTTNQLTSLDVSTNTALENLFCGSNQLTVLDVSKNARLDWFFCDNNELTILDLSKNIRLGRLKCHNNRLTTLNIHNGNNRIIIEAVKGGPHYFIATGNPNLTCIQVDDVIYSRNNFINIDSHANFSEDCSIPILTTSIPNANFEQKLIDLGYDIGTPNGTVLTANITDVTSLDISNKQITNLAGIEAFKSLTELRCNNNQLTILNLISNTALTILDCSDNLLTYLNVKNGNNTRLTSFNAVNNPNLDCIQVDDLGYSAKAWSNIDNTASFSTDDCSPSTHISDANFEQALIELNIDSNGKDGTILTADITNITSLDISYRRIRNLAGIEAFTALTELNCSNNQLTTLSLPNNIALTELNCSNNQLTSLDISNNIALSPLLCSYNQLTSLDISNNIALNSLWCSNNRLTSLNLSNNIKLVSLNCENNQLRSLNVRNGNNANIRAPHIFFNTINNPNLTCIEVDDSSYSKTNWLNKDRDAFYNENCTTAGDKDFELAGIYIFPNPTSRILNITIPESSSYKLLNIRGRIIKEGILTAGDNEINILSLVKGIYLLNIKNNKYRFAQKVIRY